jgi:WD40 repeat protein
MVLQLPTPYAPLEAAALAEYKAACEAAYNQPLAHVKAQMPMAAVEVGANEADYGLYNTPDTLGYRRLPHIGAQTVQAVRAVACLNKTLVRQGTYTDGAAAYRLDYNVRLISWPEGQPLAGQFFQGGPAPETKHSDGPVHGSALTDIELLAWILQNLEASPPGLYLDLLTYALAVSADGQIYAATVSWGYPEDEGFQLIRLPDKTSLFSVEGEWAGAVSLQPFINFSADGRFLAVGGWDDNQARVYRIPDGQLLLSVPASQSVSSGQPTATPMLSFDAGGEPLTAVALSPDGALLAAGNEEGNLRVWRVADGALLYQPADWQVKLYALAFSPDGRWLAAGQKRVGLWNAVDGQAGGTLYGHDYAVQALAFSPDGKLLAGASGFHRLTVWQIDAKRQLFTANAESFSVESLAFSPDGQILAMGGASGEILLWRATDGKLLATLLGHTMTVEHLAFTPDGQSLVSSSLDRTMRVWDLTWP